MALVNDFKGLIRGKEYFITMNDEDKKRDYNGVYKYTGCGMLVSIGSVSGNPDTPYAIFRRKDGNELDLLGGTVHFVGDDMPYFRCLFDGDKPLEIHWGHDADLCSHKNWRPCLVQKCIETQN